MNKKPDGKASPLDEEAIRRIGNKLRESYDSVANEPVPDKFSNLLDELERAEKSEGGK